MNYKIEKGFFTPSSLAISEAETQEGGWGKYDTDARATSVDLHPLLGGENLFGVVENLKTQYGFVHGADFMGQGSRLVQLGVDRSLAVSLGFFEKHMLEDIDRSQLTLFASDIMLPETWNTIHAHGPFHIILCTPGAGDGCAWGRSKQPDNDLFEFIERAIHELVPGGLFLFQNGDMHDEIVCSYLAEEIFMQHKGGLIITHSIDREGTPLAEFKIQRIRMDIKFAETVVTI